MQGLKKKCEADTGKSIEQVVPTIGQATPIESQLSLVLSNESPTATTKIPNGLSNTGCGLYYSEQGTSTDWIIDSGATDHMTFDKKDLVVFTQPKWTCIANANGVTYHFTRAGKFALSLSFSLPNTLLVPSLSNKLLSVGQPT